MNPILKNILAVIIGVFVGSFVNSSLINIGMSTYPLEGIDINSEEFFENYRALVPTLEFKYFIFPFLAHAIGTLVGAIIAGLLAVSNKMKFSLIIGAVFLLGGIMINYMLRGQIWFTIVDILFAYIPMAWIGGKIAMKFSKEN